MHHWYTVWPYFAIKENQGCLKKQLCSVISTTTVNFKSHVLTCWYVAAGTFMSSTYTPADIHLQDISGLSSCVYIQTAY